MNKFPCRSNFDFSSLNLKLDASIYLFLIRKHIRHMNINEEFQGIRTMQRKNTMI